MTAIGSRSSVAGTTSRLCMTWAETSRWRSHSSERDLGLFQSKGRQRGGPDAARTLSGNQVDWSRVCSSTRLRSDVQRYTHPRTATVERIMTDLVAIGALGAAAGWAASKVLGPTLDEMGDDLKTLYARGRDRLFDKAARKIADDDNKQANLRAARDILWNGAFSKDELSLEYFSGLLAASRSIDGADDSTIPFVDCVKSMSSQQTLLHYSIYHAFGNMVVNGIDGGKRDRHKSAYDIVGHEKICLISWGERQDINLFTLQKIGLISSFNYGSHTLWYSDVGKEAALPYLTAAPTAFGIMLYCSAYNKLEWWQAYGLQKYEPFDGIKVPEIYGPSLEEVVDIVMAESWRP